MDDLQLQIYLRFFFYTCTGHFWNVGFLTGHFLTRNAFLTVLARDIIRIISWFIMSWLKFNLFHLIKWYSRESRKENYGPRVREEKICNIEIPCINIESVNFIYRIHNWIWLLKDSWNLEKFSWFESNQWTHTPQYVQSE